MQWRIQDYPEGASTAKVSVLFSKFVAENCMKMKEFGSRLLRRGGGHASLVPP